jgi:hypothetical protein
VIGSIAVAVCWPLMNADSRGRFSWVGWGNQVPLFSAFIRVSQRQLLLALKKL